MNRSPDRNTFQINKYIKRCEDNGEDPQEDYIDMFRKEIQQDLDNEQDSEWKKENLEYDLRSTEWICDKVKGSNIYAQNLYAALCNNDFQKNEVWPILKKQLWSCSWRYAGGIVAHMREQGDYIDWYCSGIKGDMVTEDSEEFAQYTPEQRTRCIEVKQYVSESHVTDEIQADLLKLGWIVANPE